MANIDLVASNEFAIILGNKSFLLDSTAAFKDGVMIRILGASTICLLASCIQDADPLPTPKQTDQRTKVEPANRPASGREDISQEDRETIRAMIQDELSANLNICTPVAIQMQRMPSGDLEVSWSLDNRRGPTAVFRKVNGQWSEISSRWSEVDQTSFNLYTQLYFSPKAREISRNLGTE